MGIPREGLGARYDVGACFRPLAREREAVFGASHRSCTQFGLVLYGTHFAPVSVHATGGVGIALVGAVGAHPLVAGELDAGRFGGAVRQHVIQRGNKLVALHFDGRFSCA